MKWDFQRIVSALTANDQDINMAFQSLISPDFESESVPNTPQGQAPALKPEPAGAAGGGKINVIQFCHLKKHCSEETCIDYLDMESMMATPGKEIYTERRRIRCFFGSDENLLLVSLEIRRRNNRTN